MNKIKRLEVYVQKLKNQIASETNSEKLAFFKRELRKTENKIQELRK